MGKVLRIAGYARVSHEEQKKFGFSIGAQIEKVNKWVEVEKHQLVDMYVDEGFTATNMKRPDLKRMLDNLRNIDAIVFTRLDRFSRNVLEANKMLEILQQYNVAIISIEEEDIDTSTADGLFMFQLKVALAEREAKKTSERIKSVFEYKVKEGQPIQGNQPIGYKIVEENGKKKVVIDEEKREMVEDIFQHFSQYHSIRGTMEYINNKYDVQRNYITYNRIIKNEQYYGFYKGNYNYCPAYITKEEYERNQQLIKRNIRKRKTKHIHLFTGLLKCPKCGYSLAPHKTERPKYNKIYVYYMCANVYKNHCCDFKGGIKESDIEDYLLKNAERLISQKIIKANEVKSIEIKDSPEKRIKEILEEMDRLNYSFKKKRISVKQYDHDYEELEEEMKKLSEQTTEKEDITILQEFLNSGWKNIYDELNRENKRALWRNIIKEIKVREDFTFHVDFM